MYAIGLYFSFPYNIPATDSGQYQTNTDTEFRLGAPLLSAQYRLYPTTLNLHPLIPKREWTCMYFTFTLNQSLTYIPNN